MKVLSNFLLPIPIDGKRKGNRGIFGKKISFETALLILLLYNSSEDAFLLLLLYPLLVSSSLHLFIAKSGIGVFGKNNAGKGRGDDPESIGVNIDGGTKVDNPGIKTNINIGVDNLGTAADNLSIVADDLSIAIDNPGTTADNLGTAADNQGIVVDDPGTKINVDTRADNLNTAASNKVRAASLFTLCCAFFLLASSSELVTLFWLSSLPSSSSTTLWSKPILLYLVTSVKQKTPSSRYLMDKMWTLSLNKVLSGMSAIVKLL